MAFTTPVSISGESSASRPRRPASHSGPDGAVAVAVASLTVQISSTSRRRVTSPQTRRTALRAVRADRDGGECSSGLHQSSSRPEARSHVSSSRGSAAAQQANQSQRSVLGRQDSFVSGKRSAPLSGSALRPSSLGEPDREPIEQNIGRTRGAPGGSSAARPTPSTTSTAPPHRATSYEQSAEAQVAARASSASTVPAAPRPPQESRGASAPTPRRTRSRLEQRYHREKVATAPSQTSPESTHHQHPLRLPLRRHTLFLAPG